MGVMDDLDGSRPASSLGSTMDDRVDLVLGLTGAVVAFVVGFSIVTLEW